MLPELIERLTKWYWSPELPNAYVTKRGNGIGNIAFSYPASFNLTWAKYGSALATHCDEQTKLQQHATAVTYLSNVERLIHHKYGAYELSAYVTLMSRTQFEKFYIREVRATLPETLVELIDEAIHAQV